ncbi:MAG TPA: FmdB family zinc ribbon protein [Chloroflexia bacterium]|nr:FmdB family zinc ribbon protein [Chloroflexia bacterium]
MPIYEYECKNCVTRFEKMQPIMAEPLTECVNCGGGPIHRIFHPVGVIFKGSGWYINDSRKSSSPKEDGGAGASDKSDGDKSTGDKSASSESTAVASKDAPKDAPASAPASE